MSEAPLPSAALVGEAVDWAQKKAIEVNSGLYTENVHGIYHGLVEIFVARRLEIARLIEDEGIYDYEHSSIYETFGSNPFKVDIKILVQKEPSSFDSVINKIKQSTYPSRLDDMVYSVLKWNQGLRY